MSAGHHNKTIVIIGHSNEHLLVTLLFLNLAFCHLRTKTHFLVCKKQTNNNFRYNLIFKVARCTASPKIFGIKIDRLVKFESLKWRQREKQPLFQHHNVIATATAEKTMRLPFLCPSFHLQAVSIFIFSDLQIVILAFQTVWEILGGGTWKRNTHPSLTNQPWCASSEMRSQNYSTWAAPKTLVVLGRSQLSKCAAGSDFVHFKKSKNTQTHAHAEPQALAQTSAHTRTILVVFTLFPFMTLS